MSKDMLRRFSTTSAARSFIGSSPISLPSSVQVVLVNGLSDSIKDTAAYDPYSPPHLLLQGPRGKASLPLRPFVRLKKTDLDGKPLSLPLHTTKGVPYPSISPSSSPATTPSEESTLLKVSVADKSVEEQRAMWGTSRQLIANFVHGLTIGWTVPIRIVGVGYRASVETPGILSLKLGFSHPVELKIPEGIDVRVPKPDRIYLSGVDWQKLKLFAATIRSWRKPEPYNQKGIFVGDETIQKKDGKKGK